MRINGVKRFVCPDCGVGVDVHGVGIDEMRNVYLVGVCPECKDNVALDALKVLTLFEGRHGQAN